jgi:hypothetical protein
MPYICQFFFFLYLVWIWFLKDCDNSWFVTPLTPHYPGCMGNGVYQFHGELLQNPIFPIFQSFDISIFCFKVETTHFRFSSYVWVFLGDIVNWWVKEFWILKCDYNIILWHPVAHHSTNVTGSLSYMQRVTDTAQQEETPSTIKYMSA